MNRRPAQVTAVLAGEGAARGAVEGGAVIPHDHVAGLLPVEGVDVLGLLHMLVERVAQLRGLVVGETLDMMEVGADVEVHATASLVDLCKAVARHGELAGVQVLKVLGGAHLARVSEGVAADIVVLDKLLLQGIGKLDKGGAGVGKLGVTAGALRRELDGAKEREASATEVVAGVGMEELVALEKSQFIRRPASQRQSPSASPNPNLLTRFV